VGAEALAGIALGVLLVAPPFLPPYFLEILISVMLFGYLGAAWNILGGYAGQFSFGHAAYFGIGAYTSTLLFLNLGITPWLGMLAGGVLAALYGLFAGYLSFRYGLRGPYFSLVTLAFAEMLRVVAVNTRAVGSSLGLVIPNREAAPVNFIFAGKLPYYYVILAMALAAVAITRLVARSKLGYSLLAIRENEDAAEAAGVDALGMKLRAMALSSFLTALGGTFYAQYFAYIDPTITFGPSVSIQGLLQAIVGGAGTVLGPLVGAFVLTPASELSRAAIRGRAGVDVMVYGLTAVSRFSLTVGAGEIVGLIGPNGAGKTTVFHLLSGFHAPTEGAIRFKGASVVGARPHEICRRGLARTFQIVQPFVNLSVLENVMVGAFNRTDDVGAARARAVEVLEFVGLAARRDALARELTLSDRKRLEMARGLATRPELLLLDEVMSGLNPTEIEAIIGLIRRIHAQGVSLLIIEHVMRAIMALSERIVVLHHGEKIAEGAPAEVARDRRVVEAYLGESS
jgi:branched-chain amino acid transport system permease protein